MQLSYIFLIPFGEMELSLTTLIVLISLTCFIFIAVIISSLALFKSAINDED